MLIWLELLFCLAVIGYAGYFLSRYGDIIAEKTGMSASWVSLGLFMQYVFNSWLLFEHAH